MKKGKKIVFYLEELKHLEGLMPDEVGKVFLAMVTYATSDFEPEFQEQSILGAWKPIKQRLDADKEAHKARCVKWRENGLKGGRPKKAVVLPETEEKLDEGDTGIPYREIIDYLNQRAGTHFRHRSKDTRSHICGRWNEGYRLDDFKRVIDVKCSEWLGNPKMEPYIRPSTLFRPTNFENYHNQKITQKNPANSFHNFKQRDFNFSELETKLDNLLFST